MSITISTLANRIYRRLNESANSDIATLPTGTDTTYTTSAIQGIVDFYNETCGELARTCIPVPASGTIAATIGQPVYSLQNLTVSGVAYLWCATGVYYAGALVNPVGYVPMLNYVAGSGGIYNNTNGTPAYWADLGGDQSNIVVNPAPSGTSTITVGGFAVPTAAVDGTSTTAWLADDLLEIVECRICSLIAKKNLDDPTLAARIPVWDGLYYQRCEQLWERLETPLRRWRFPSNPNPNSGEKG